VNTVQLAAIDVAERKRKGLRPRSRRVAAGTLWERKTELGIDLPHSQAREGPSRHCITSVAVSSGPVNTKSSERGNCPPHVLALGALVFRPRKKKKNSVLSSPPTRRVDYVLLSEGLVAMAGGRPKKSGARRHFARSGWFSSRSRVFGARTCGGPICSKRGYRAANAPIVVATRSSRFLNGGRTGDCGMLATLFRGLGEDLWRGAAEPIPDGTRNADTLSAVLHISHQTSESFHLDSPDEHRFEGAS